MRFSVPQFIDVEDKIFGPLTFKQGIYILGSVGITVAVYLKFGLFLAALVGIPVLFLAFLLTFVKVQGRPFIHMLYSASFYALKSKLYLWKKTQKKHLTQDVEKTQTTRPVSVSMSQSKLRQLAWSLDTNNLFDKDKKTH